MSKQGRPKKEINMIDFKILYNRQESREKILRELNITNNEYYLLKRRVEVENCIRDYLQQLHIEEDNIYELLDKVGELL